MADPHAKHVTCYNKSILGFFLSKKKIQIYFISKGLTLIVKIIEVHRNLPDISSSLDQCSVIITRENNLELFSQTWIINNNNNYRSHMILDI